MSSALPRISVITSSYNQGRFIGETIESVRAQNYPNLEHIVVDGMSTDETEEVLARYSHLRVVREPDKGQADALNKGFALATGDVLCFLNSDDTLQAGALERVAREIDPTSGRCVVMGRCRFIDEESRYLGIEHPSHFESFARMLEVWKGYFVPQPAVFWSANVWRECGPLRESSILDYDLFCRFSQKYRFHYIDSVLATYRLHAHSKTTNLSDHSRLQQCVQVSRKYWGSPLRPMYWRLTASLLLYRFNRQGRGNRLYRRAVEAWRQHQRIDAFRLSVAASVLAPEIAFHVGIYPRVRKLGAGALRRALDGLAGTRGVYPQTAVYMDHNAAWEDGWAGPNITVPIEAAGGEQSVVIQGWVDLTHIVEPFVLRVAVDGREVGSQQITQSGNFGFKLPLSMSIAPGSHRITVETSTWWVSHKVNRSGDYRPLCWRICGADSFQFRN
jgi:glycosyltransferase involved in cell wall biosynthesis